jgi:heme exporter protein D
MNWTSWDAFVAMGGHGLYVWGSVLLVLGAVAAELALVTWRRQAALRLVRQNLEKRG